MIENPMVIDSLWHDDPQDDAWDIESPDWSRVLDMIDNKYSEHQIAELVRDYIDGSYEISVDIYEAGLLDDYINPALQMKDADEVDDEVDRVMDAHWYDDKLMLTIYEQLENVQEGIGEMLIENADYNGIRELYNESRRE